MITGTPEHLTDEQLLKLMSIVSDDVPIELDLPDAPFKAAILLRNGIKYYIGPDGEFVTHP